VQYVFLRGGGKLVEVLNLGAISVAEKFRSGSRRAITAPRLGAEAVVDDEAIFSHEPFRHFHHGRGGPVEFIFHPNTPALCQPCGSFGLRNCIHEKTVEPEFINGA